MNSNIEINLNDIDNIEAFHDLLSQKFFFPHYYGKNQNAFWDCINELFGKYEVKILGLKSINRNIKEEVLSYVDMLKNYEKNTNGEFKLILLD